jgi:predicted metal-dependent HD superfamily phosphohydrolase
MPSKLEDRWLRFWKQAGGNGDPSLAYEDLVARYSEVHRAYHTLAHIEHCLREFDAARPLAKDALAVEMAIWYHDIIYNPWAKDNEERSAVLAGQVALRMGLPSARRKKVERLILASRHKSLPSGPDEQLFTDIDLSILGQNQKRFAEYEKQVRREYKWVPGVIFREKRASILRSFLDRPALYATTFFRKRFEARARENLERSLRRVKPKWEQASDASKGADHGHQGFG